MLILLKFCVALAAMYCLGFGLAGFLTQGLGIPRRTLTLPLGYSASLFLYQALLRKTWDLDLSFTATLAALGVLSAVYALVLYRRRRASPLRFTRPDAEHLALWGMLLLVLAVAIWPYMAAGWGNYWHSGNPDLIDPLYSRDIIIGYAKHLQAAPGDPARLDPAALKNHLTSLDEYFRFPIHLQYTAMVFWTHLLRAFEGLDAFMVQAVLNLLLLSHGVYALMRRSLGSRPIAALLGAAGCSTCTFYFTTYINGHEGSMMFMALIPYLLLVALDWHRGWAAGWRQCAVLGIFVAFMAITYPFPLAFFLPPLLLHALYTGLLAPRGGLAWVRAWWASRPFLLKALLIVVLLGAMAGGFAVVWHLTSPVRTRSTFQFRSWRLMETVFRDVLFWGLWPSPVAFGQSGHVNFINLSRTVPLLGWPLTILSVGWAWAMYALTALWGWRLRARVQPFYLCFLFLWPVFLLAMQHIVVDPYFIYKFTYTTQFLLIVILVHGWHAFTRESPGSFARKAALVIVPVWFAVNLANDATSAYSLLKRQYNTDYASYRGATTLPRETVAKTWVAIPLLDHREIVLYTLRNHGLATSESLADAAYVLDMKGYRDILTSERETSGPVWENSRFALYPNDTRNAVELRSNIAVELMSLKDTAQVPFRWVSDEEAFNLPGGFITSYTNITSNSRYLRFCVESGPSFDYHPFTLNVFPGVGKTETVDIFNPGYVRTGPGSSFMSLHLNARTCFWIDLKDLDGHEQPFHFAPDRRGRSILPYDERKLDFKLAQLGLTSERYDRQGLLFLTDPRDIVPPEHSQALHAGQALPAPAVLLGNGWYPSEQQGPGFFRWAEKDAEVLVLNRDGRPCRLTLEMESGPNLAGRDASLSALGERGETLWSGSLGGRTKVQFSVPTSEARVMPIRLTPSKIPAALPDDPRALAFRVFSISIEPEPGPKP